MPVCEHDEPDRDQQHPAAERPERPALLDLVDRVHRAPERGRVAGDRPEQQHDADERGRGRGSARLSSSRRRALDVWRGVVGQHGRRDRREVLRRPVAVVEERERRDQHEQRGQRRERGEERQRGGGVDAAVPHEPVPRARSDRRDARCRAGAWPGVRRRPSSLTAGAVGSSPGRAIQTERVMHEGDGARRRSRPGGRRRRRRSAATVPVRVRATAARATISSVFAMCTMRVFAPWRNSARCRLTGAIASTVASAEKPTSTR